MIRGLLGTVTLTGLICLTIPTDAQEIPKNFDPVGRIVTPEQDKDNNGVRDSEEKTLNYNNSTYKYFKVYHKETRKQTLFIADQNYKIIEDPELYHHLFSVITMNEIARRAKKQNFSRHLNEWASDYEKINKAILITDVSKKAVEALSELEGFLINKTFFGGTRVPKALDYVLSEGSIPVAKKRTDNDFKEVLLELADGLSRDNPREVAPYVLTNIREITAAKITAARRSLLVARKRLETYNPDKDFWSLPQAERFVQDLLKGLEGLTFARAYLSSLGEGNSLKAGAKLVAENFAAGFTGVSVDDIVDNLSKNKHLQKVKGVIEESRTKLAKVTSSLHTVLDPKQDLTLRSLLSEENPKFIERPRAEEAKTGSKLEDRIEPIGLPSDTLKELFNIMKENNIEKALTLYITEKECIELYRILQEREFTETDKERTIKEYRRGKGSFSEAFIEGSRLVRQNPDSKLLSVGGEFAFAKDLEAKIEGKSVNIPCFHRAYLKIMIERGHSETVKIGDVIVTKEGKWKMIVW